MRNRINNLDNASCFFVLNSKEREVSIEKKKKNVTGENVMKNLFLIEHV